MVLLFFSRINRIYSPERSCEDEEVLGGRFVVLSRESPVLTRLLIVKYDSETPTQGIYSPPSINLRERRRIR